MRRHFFVLSVSLLAMVGCSTLPSGENAQLFDDMGPHREVWSRADELTETSCKCIPKT